VKIVSFSDAGQTVQAGLIGWITHWLEQEVYFDDEEGVVTRESALVQVPPEVLFADLNPEDEEPDELKLNVGSLPVSLKEGYDGVGLKRLPQSGAVAQYLWHLQHGRRMTTGALQVTGPMKHGGDFLPGMGLLKGFIDATGKLDSLQVILQALLEM